MILAVAATYLWPRLLDSGPPLRCSNPHAISPAASDRGASRTCPRWIFPKRSQAFKPRRLPLRRGAQTYRTDPLADDSISTDVGDRYAQALFDLALETGQLDAVEKDLRSMRAMLGDSLDLRRLIASPAFSSDDKGRAIGAIADKARFAVTTKKFLGLLAANSRVSALNGSITAFHRLAAKHRGTVAAEVTTAVELTRDQRKDLQAALRQALGKDPEITTRVDPSILGGLRVKVGSRLYDASLRSKLDQMKFALKRA